MIQLVYPWLLFLLPAPWLIRKLLPPRRVRQTSVKVPFGKRLRIAMGDKVSTSSTHVSRIHFAQWIVWILVLIALARPQIEEPPVSKNLPTRDLLLLVDLSGSMQHEDFTDASGEQIDRLTAVKEVVGNFLSQREGDRVGLVVFGDSPFLQAPFSTDLELSRRLLEETAIGMAGPRTALGDAIGLGIRLFDDSEAPAKTIIALTDGNDTKSQVPPIEAARIASQNGIRIHTVAIGDPTTVGEEKLDEQTLRDVAKSAGGSYFFAADREELTSIYDELDRIETREVKVISHFPRRDLYYWPLLFALFIAMLPKVLALRGQRLASRSDPQSVRVDPLSGKLEITS